MLILFNVCMLCLQLDCHILLIDKTEWDETQAKETQQQYEDDWDDDDVNDCFSVQLRREPVKYTVKS